MWGRANWDGGVIIWETWQHPGLVVAVAGLGAQPGRDEKKREEEEAETDMGENEQSHCGHKRCQKRHHHHGGGGHD